METRPTSLSCIQRLVFCCFETFNSPVFKWLTLSIAFLLFVSLVFITSYFVGYLVFAIFDVDTGFWLKLGFGLFLFLKFSSLIPYHICSFNLKKFIVLLYTAHEDVLKDRCNRYFNHSLQVIQTDWLKSTLGERIKLLDLNNRIDVHCQYNAFHIAFILCSYVFVWILFPFLPSSFSNDFVIITTSTSVGVLILSSGIDFVLLPLIGHFVFSWQKTAFIIQ